MKLKYKNPVKQGAMTSAMMLRKLSKAPEKKPPVKRIGGPKKRHTA